MRFKKNKKKKESGFKCSHCRQWVPTSGLIGTAHRNHCPLCLWSKHVDLEKPGDRKSECQAGMEPIGLTFKHEAWNKQGRPRQGELMLIHHCTQCEKITINRIAADDSAEAILSVFEKSKGLENETLKQLDKADIRLLNEEDREEVTRQLYGKEI